MATPAISTNFTDLLDPRFKRIFNDRYKQLPDRLGEFFSMKSGSDFPTKADARFSSVGTFDDVGEFSGSVSYDDVYQGYDVTLTHKEYAKGFQIERKLYDDELFGIMDGKPSGLATAVQRTRQKHGASLFNNAFSIDSTWLNHTENVAMCSDSHTTTSGASTASGFDNLVTTAFSAVALAAARIQMRGFRGDRAERMSVNPTGIIHPPNLYDLVYEVVQSSGKPDTANNNANVHKGVYTAHDWEYMTDTNNWLLVDEDQMKENQLWIDRVPMEFGMVEDFDTLLGKWRVYYRYSLGWLDWRHILGAQVS